MATPWLFTHTDVRASGDEIPISNEPHVVGEDLANLVMLNEVPKQFVAPSSVSIPGFTEVTGTPAAGQFRVFYTAYHSSYVQFHPDDNGEPVLVSYTGRGSARLARDLNRIQEIMHGLRVSVAEFGVVPGASPTVVRDGIQAAADYVGVLGGGTFYVPVGVYDWGAFTSHPYRASARHSLDIKYDNLRMDVLRGAWLKLAAGMQTDAGGPVDLIVGRERINFTLEGGGKITGNTAGQTGWTGGYQQASGAGSGVHFFRATGGFGVKNFTVRNIELSDFFSNPVDVLGDPAMPVANVVTFERIYSSGVGEGLEVQACKEVRYLYNTIEDPTNVMVGDGMECSACDDVIGIGNVARAVHADGGAGSAFDMYGSKHVLWMDALVDGWSTGLGLSTTLDVSARTVEYARIVNCEFRNVRANVLEAAAGVCSFDNVTVINCPSTGFQFTGTSVMPPVEVRGCYFVDCDVGGQVRGSRKVNFDSCHFVSNTNDGLGVVRVAPGDSPVVKVHAGTIRENGRYGLYVDSQGDGAYVPEVVIDGVVFESNTTHNIFGAVTNVSHFSRKRGMQASDTITLAAGASTNIRNFGIGTSAAKPLGVATVAISTGQSALFSLKGSGNGVTKLAESDANVFVITPGAEPRVVVGYYPFTEGGTYRVANLNATPVTITVSFVGQT